MKVVIQRVTEANLKVDGEMISEIGKGLVVYLGIQKGDSITSAEKLAKKIVNMRIFEDENGKLMFSSLDLNLDILLVSQFTLCADCSHGNRPDFFNAETPEIAKAMYLEFAELLSKNGITPKMGVFGADMKIMQANDGPVTICLEV